MKKVWVYLAVMCILLINRTLVYGAANAADTMDNAPVIIEENNLEEWTEDSKTEDIGETEIFDEGAAVNEAENSEEADVEEEIEIFSADEDEVIFGDGNPDVFFTDGDEFAENSSISDEEGGYGYCVNPFYADLFDEDDLKTEEAETGIAKARGTQPVFSDYDAASAYVREKMVQRETRFTLTWSYTDPVYSFDAANRIMDNIFKNARAHTGIPDEGDYIYWQWFASRWTPTYKNKCIYYTVSSTYLTDSGQEAEVDAKIREVLDSLDLESKSTYEKVEKIYDYLCTNISYDYENLNDDNYKLKHTAYAGLIQHKCVCQGYAVLLYRMCLEAGIDSRVVCGWTSADRKTQDGHLWNIINISGSYYYADATWDAGKNADIYDYFLECWNSFNSPSSHAAYYNSPAVDTNGLPVYQNYTISSRDFWRNQGSCGNNLTWKLSDDGILKISGKGRMNAYGYQKFPWSSESKKIKKIILSYGITSIAEYAFYGCNSISEMSFPDSVTDIGRSAFCNCTNLKTIELPKGITSLTESVFEECDSLISLHIPDSVTKIDGWVFMGCNSLKTLIIPAKVTNIGDGVFLGSGLQTLCFTGEVPVIGGNVFDGVTADIYYPHTWSEHPDIGAMYGSLTWKKCLLSNCTISVSPTKYVYDGKAKKPEITVKAGSLILRSGTDYSVSYRNHINAGTATAIVSGKGLWKETKLLNYTIEKIVPSLSFARNEVTKIYGESAFQNILTKNTDGIIKYTSENTDVATVDRITGIVTIHRAGKTTITAESDSTSIYKAGRASYTLNVKPKVITRDYSGTYDGKAHTADISAEGNAQVYYSVDTRLDYGNYTTAGSKTKPSRTVSGEREVYYIAIPAEDANSNNVVCGSVWIKILKRNNTIAAANIKKAFSTKARTMNIGAKANEGAKLVFFSNHKSVTVNSAGKVKIAKKFIGKATITIRASATENYKAASKKITVTVNPAGTKILKTGNISKKRAQIKWKRNNDITGYEIQYSTNKKFQSNVKKKNITGKSITSAQLTNLKKGKRYYVRIRTYKKIGKTKYYSAWSAKKSIK